jgi:hypothetical protein
MPLIQCVPTFPGHTIDWLESAIPDLSPNATVHTVDYTHMHKCFGQPFKDVLCHYKHQTKGFPKDLDFPGEVPVCPGCAQGKMPSQAHSPYEMRASAPFEKVHSDLKSFPVSSYHKFKYFMSFINDFTLYAWIVCLPTKGVAISALKHFIALVKNQFGTTVKSGCQTHVANTSQKSLLPLSRTMGYTYCRAHHTLLNRTVTQSASCASAWTRHRLCA